MNTRDLSGFPKMLKLLLATLIFSNSFKLWAADSRMVEEIAVQIIPLAAPLDQDIAEISGLAWCQGRLVLLPQFPKRLSKDGESYFYYLERQQILDYIDGVSTQPLKPKPILVNENGLRKTVTFFDGFEAIACGDNKLWLSIEALTLVGGYQSFVVPGVVDFTENPKITIDQKYMVQLETQSKLANMGDEAIVMHGGDVIAIHEVNDAAAVKKPKARRVNNRFLRSSELAFPNLPYRITDATELDEGQRFWAINYKYSGEEFSRNSTDPLEIKFGQGASHKKYDNVERLIEFQLDDGGISLLEQAPIQLLMTDVEGRNWEGIVRLKGRGFLLATDKHPATLLGFVPIQQ
jgi:hypothetical protein